MICYINNIFNENSIIVLFFGLISGLILISASGGGVYWFEKWGRSSITQIIAKGRNIFIAFLDSHEYSSLTLHPNLTYSSFLKVICSIESKTTSVYFSYLQWNPLVCLTLWMSCLLFCDFIYCSFRKWWFTELFRSSKWWHIYYKKPSFINITTHQTSLWSS